MTCTFSYYVRVTKMPPDAYNAVLLYTIPATTTNTTSVPVSSNPVNEISFPGGATLCFSEDPKSTVHGIHIDIDKCPSCTSAPSWQDQVMSVTVSAPSIGSGGTPLLLKAQEIAVGDWRYAANNPPGIDGGRPIIRNSFGHVIIYVAIAVVAFGVIYMLVKWWNSSQPKGP